MTRIHKRAATRSAGSRACGVPGEVSQALAACLVLLLASPLAAWGQSDEEQKAEHYLSRSTNRSPML